MKKKLAELKNRPVVRRTRNKMSTVFNSRAFKVAAVVKEGAFIATLGVAAATGVLAPLSAALMTTSHGMALSRSVKKLLAPAPRRRAALGW